MLREFPCGRRRWKARGSTGQRKVETAAMMGWRTAGTLPSILDACTVLARSAAIARAALWHPEDTAPLEVDSEV